MDNWKYYDIIHRYHAIMNPVDEAKLDLLFDLLRLGPKSKIIDIGSGKGEMLIRLAEKYSVKGIGIDKSPYSIRDAEKRKKERLPGADLKFLEMDGASYKPDEGQLADLSMCIGASWIYDGYRNTIRALSRMTKPLGYVMSGEPYWRKEPPEEYLKVEAFPKSLFDTHVGNATSGEKEGLRLIYTLDSSEESWDRYEGLHWYAADKFAASNPDDPDLEELLKRVSKFKESYLKWGRECLGWAIYLFRKTF